MFLLMDTGFSSLQLSLLSAPDLEGRRKENVNGGKFTSVIPVWLLKVRVESLCLEPAQQFHLVPRECLKSHREK